MAAFRNLIRTLALLAFAAMSGCASSCSSTPVAPHPSMPVKERVVINNETFMLEVVANDAKRQLGLKHRTSIPDHEGMLFVFPDSMVQVQSFWMHECLIDIDIIFLDPGGRVTATHRMKAQPPRRADETEEDYQDRMHEHSYPSGYPAQFAIELKAGSLDRLNVRVEQKIELDIPRLKAMAQ